MLTLFSVPWSLNCRRAEELLKEHGVKYRKVEFTQWGELADLARDFGLRRLPFLFGEGVVCEGFKQIEEFIHTRSCR